METTQKIEGRRAVIVTERRAEFERVDFGQPRGAQVLVEMESTIISAGTELAIYTGLDANTRVPGQWATWPFRSGYGGVGRVIAAGPEAIFPVGERLFGIHNHASHAMPDTKAHICVLVPHELDSVTAAVARLASVAMTASRRVQGIGQSLMGARVLVIGLGLVGNLAGQLFRVAGARVAGVDPAAHRREIAARCGFVGALDSSIESLGEAAADVLGGAPDVVIEGVGDSRLVEQAVHLVRPGGTVVLLGAPRAPHQTNATEAWSEVFGKSLQVLGAFEYGIPMLRRTDAGAVARDISVQDNASLVMGLLADKRLVAHELVKTVAPGELDAAYNGLLERKDEFLGVVLDWKSNALPPATYKGE